jgi:hypothetical protein
LIGIKSNSAAIKEVDRKMNQVKEELDKKGLTLKCVFKKPGRENDFGHWEQLKGFSPVGTVK